MPRTKTHRMAAPISVMVAESVGARDFYLRRTDGYAAHEVLRIQQVKTEYRVILDKARLIRAIAESCMFQFKIFHLSCHGNDDGIGLSDGSFLDWLSLGRLFRRYASLEKVLVLSCCSGGYVGVTKAFQKENIVFGFVFGSTALDGVGFTDSCLAWSILYSRLLEHGFALDELRETLDKINFTVPGKFMYRRWSGSRYLRYPRFDTR
jgi:hypothetical protein